MLTANQFHKQSGLTMDFQDFLGRMKEKFGEAFMESVNAGEVTLEQVQDALGMKKPKAKPKADMSRAQRKSATGMKCSSCEAEKKSRQPNALRNVAILAGVGLAIYFIAKKRK